MVSRKPDYTDWWNSPQCEAYRSGMIFRDTNLNLDEVPTKSHWYLYLESTVFKRSHPDRWLSLCCGRGGLERYFSKQNQFQSCLAVDASESQLKKARAAARAAGIGNVAYRQEDLNVASFPQDTFDFVIAQGGIHHIKNLDGLFGQITQSLRLGGLLVMHEYVGPLRWRLSDWEVIQIDKAMSLIPDEFRPSLNPNRYWCLRPYDLRPDAWYKRLSKIAYYQLLMVRDQSLDTSRRRYVTHRRFNPSYFQPLLDKDPSESVSGENILPTLERYFEIVDVRPIGGSIISWILDFDWTFDLSNPAFIEVIHNLIAFEKSLIDSGQIASHYASIVVRNIKK